MTDEEMLAFIRDALKMADGISKQDGLRFCLVISDTPTQLVIDINPEMVRVELQHRPNAKPLAVVELQSVSRTSTTEDCILVFETDPGATLEVLSDGTFRFNEQ